MVKESHSLLGMRSQVNFVFGRIVKRRRDKLKLTPDYVARHAKIALSTLEGIESGNKDCSLLMLFRLADALDIPAAELMNRTKKQYQVKRVGSTRRTLGPKR